MPERARETLLGNAGDLGQAIPMFRISGGHSIPFHHESVPLRGGAVVLGWVLAVAGIGCGLSLAALARDWPAELLAPCLVVLGGLALVGVVRCRRYEVTLGSTRIDLRAGPFKRIVPSAAVESADRRPATGWRRLFGAEEMVLRVNVGSGKVAVPSRKPADVLGALAQIADGGP